MPATSENKTVVYEQCSWQLCGVTCMIVSRLISSGSRPRPYFVRTPSVHRLYAVSTPSLPRPFALGTFCSFLLHTLKSSRFVRNHGRGDHEPEQAPNHFILSSFPNQNLFKVQTVYATTRTKQQPISMSTIELTLSAFVSGGSLTKRVPSAGITTHSRDTPIGISKKALDKLI